MAAPRTERRLRVETPEGLDLHLELGTVGERIAALAVDLAVIALAYAFLGSFFFFSLDAWALVLLAGFVLRHGYFLFFELRWQGTTPGKRLLGLRVTPRDGGSLDARSVIARNLMRDVELVLPLVVLARPEMLTGESPIWIWLPALAWVAALALLPVFHPHRMRAGDLVAGTVVIRLPRAPLQLDEAGVPNQVRIDLRPEHLSIYGAKELDALAHLLREADSDHEGGRHLLSRVAKTIADKVGYRGAPAERTPEEFLRAFYGAQRAFLERQRLYGWRKPDKDGRFEAVQ